MNSEMIIVEKVNIDLNTGRREEVFALCSGAKTARTPRFSLTYEGYISDWTPDRNALDAEIAASAKASLAQTTV